ncbi:MAG TPA: alpha/beta hydrolase [Amycolatopsis sp.]|nr:alpha/beta hydrolase [Amycolatopsis sp.]
MATGRARNGSIELVYRVAAEGRPLLLISGNGAQMGHWPGAFVAALTGRGFRVAMFDNRDIGQSTHVEEPYSLGDLAGDALAVLDALGWHSAHVMGLSLGGMVGQVLAARHPARVRSLTTMSASPAAGWRTVRPRLRTLLKVLALGRPDGTREAAGDFVVKLTRIIGSPGYPFDEKETRDIAVRAHDISDDRAGTARQLHAVATSGDRRGELGLISAPTLVVHGEADPLLSVRAGRATAAAIPGARLLTFPDVGHDLVPPALWPQFLDAVTDLADSAEVPG